MTQQGPENSDNGIRRDNSAEKWLFTEAKNVRMPLLAVVAAASVIGVLVVVQASVLSEACQRVVMQGKPAASVLPLAGILAAVAVGRCFCAYLLETRAATAAARVKLAVRKALYRKIQLLGPAGLAGAESGSLIETTTKGVDDLEPYITRFLPQLFLAALLPPLFLIVIVPSEWRSGLVLLLSAPFIPLFMVLIGRGSESLHRSQWQRLSLMADHLLDLVQGLPDLIVSGATKKAAHSVARVSDDYRSATMSVLRIAFLSAFTLEFFATVGTALVAVIIAFRLLSGVLSLREGLFVLLMAPEFYLPLRNLGLSYHARIQGVSAAERIAPLLATSLPSGFAGTVVLPNGPPDVVFEGVSFSYAGDRGKISCVDLHLPAGSITALAGGSGAGKTTLARLLIGLTRPDSGRIVIDGEDLSKLAPDSWQARVAWVAQTPFFTSGTVRENLLLGRPDATSQEIEQSLEAAAARHFVARLPSGLDTPLGDRGAGLSGGELKRLALARAYVCRADLIVLDEPTAGLDRDSERLVCDALQNVASGRTVLVISHREQTLSCADRVIEMCDGRIVSTVPAPEYLQAEGRAV